MSCIHLKQKSQKVFTLWISVAHFTKKQKFILYSLKTGMLVYSLYVLYIFILS